MPCRAEGLYRARDEATQKEGRAYESARKSATRVAAAPAPGGVSFAARIVDRAAPLEPKAARARVADWLSGLGAAEAKPLNVLLASQKTLNALLESLAESSPYLWELASSDPRRLLRLLDGDPDRHLAALLAETAAPSQRRRMKPKRCGCCAA